MNRTQPVARCCSIVVMILLCLCARSASASSDPAALCDAAARDAASATGVPADVLLALTRTETGRSMNGVLQPWPWAINQAGEGLWFPTEDAMLGHIGGLIATGVTNFDVGCFQLNYRWHGAAFASMAEMSDPGQNARYAARYIAGKFATAGDWGQAAAAYHSGTPEYAARYLVRFQEIYAGLDLAMPAPAASARTRDRPNLFPLLVAGRSGGGGSLVPLAASGRRLIGGNPEGGDE
jgi:hypothetical protein